MSDAWDSLDELEPLDDASLGLLASYREAKGPSADAEARMLAGLRARIVSEALDPEPANTTPSAEVPTQHVDTAQGRVRTLAVAVLAFAAGVALTVSLDRGQSPSKDDPEGGAAPRVVERVIYRNGARSEAPRPNDPFVRTLGSDDAADGSNAPGRVVEADAPLPWPLSMTQPVSAEPEPNDRMPSAVDEADPAPVTPRSTTIEDGRDHAEPRPQERGADDSSPLHRPRPGQAARAPGHGPGPLGASAPSVTPSPSVAGVSSVARNPAVGGSPAPAGPPRSPSEPSTAPHSDGGGDEPPPRDAEPASDRSGEPPPGDEPPPEDEPVEDELPLEEACEEALQACYADAGTYCAWNIDGCEYAFEFCNIRYNACRGDTPSPSPDDPAPFDCGAAYDMCTAEINAMCEFEEIPQDECAMMWVQCEDEFTGCENEDPW